jgi:hypothetical protein
MIAKESECVLWESVESLLLKLGKIGKSDTELVIVDIERWKSI